MRQWQWKNNCESSQCTRVVKSEGFPQIVFAFHHSCCYFFPNKEKDRRYGEAVSQDGRTLLTFFSPSLPFPWVLYYQVRQKWMIMPAQSCLIWNSVPALLFFVSGCRQSLPVFFQKHELTRTIFLISATFQKQMLFLSNSPVYLMSQQIPHLIQQGRNVTLCNTGN